MRYLKRCCRWDTRGAGRKSSLPKKLRPCSVMARLFASVRICLSCGRPSFRQILSHAGDANDLVTYVALLCTSAPCLLVDGWPFAEGDLASANNARPRWRSPLSASGMVVEGCMEAATLVLLLHRHTALCRRLRHRRSAGATAVLLLLATHFPQ